MDVPTTIKLNIGEIYTLRLAGLGTAGYRWTYESIENGNLIDVSATAGTSQQGNGSRLSSIGSSADEIFTIRAIAAGHSTIRFVQRRPWEQNHPPLNQHTLEITIKPQGE